MSDQQTDLFGEPVEPEPEAKPGKSPADLPPAPPSILRTKARTCREGCGALIVLAATTRTMRNGVERSGWMPVDIEQDPRDGNVRLHMEGRIARAYVLNEKQRAGITTLHRSHMETCTARDRAPRSPRRN